MSRESTRYLIAEKTVSFAAEPAGGVDPQNPGECWWYMPTGSLVRNIRRNRSGLWTWEYSHDYGLHWSDGSDHRRPRCHVETDEEAAKREYAWQLRRERATAQRSPVPV